VARSRGARAGVSTWLGRAGAHGGVRAGAWECAGRVGWLCRWLDFWVQVMDP
jgi:hypothetical protein